MDSLKQRLYSLLRQSERYTKTDMVYLFKSGFWMNAGAVLVALFSLLLYLAFANFLPKEVYGTYQYLLAVSTVIGAFTLTGMNSAVTRAVARGSEGTVSYAVRVQLAWSLLPFLLGLGAASYYYLQGNLLLAGGLALIAIFVPLNNALNTYGALVGGRADFRRGFFFNLFLNLLHYPSLIVAAYVSDLALVLLAVNFVVQCVGLFLIYHYALRIYKPNTTVDTDAIRYGKHLSLMGFINAATAQLDSILVFHFLGAAPLAIYSFATGIPERLASMTKFIPAAAFPKLAVKDAREARASLAPKLVWALLGSALIAGAYMLSAEFIFLALFPAYQDAVPYSILYALIIIPWVSGILTTALTAGQSTRALYIFNSAGSVIQLAFMLIGVVLWGLWGLVVARLASASAQFVLSAWLFFKGDGTASATHDSEEALSQRI